jgi:hypothetical protein
LGDLKKSGNKGTGEVKARIKTRLFSGGNRKDSVGKNMTIHQQRKTMKPQVDVE